MFRARTAGAAPAVDQPVGVSRRQRRGNGIAARGFANGAGLLARIVQLVVSVVVLIIVAGILLVVLKANPTNSIVSGVHGWARWLAGPFDGMFSFHSANVTIAVNWGIAAVVYLFIGVLIARLLGRTHRYHTRED
jgi:membrane-bound ClpP family serine protease